MPRWTWMAPALMLMACGKDLGDTGSPEPPATCDDFLTTLSNCYGQAGFELADGGYDTETWCAAYDETPAPAGYFDCLEGRVMQGDCSSAEGIATLSATFVECEPTEASAE